MYGRSDLCLVCVVCVLCVPFCLVWVICLGCLSFLPISYIASVVHCTCTRLSSRPKTNVYFALHCV